MEAVTALSFDVDDEPAWELLDDYEYAAHTTFSHTEDAPRWRIVLPLTRPVPAEQWASVWERARLRLCPNADEACRDASRFFWKPACRPGAARRALHHKGVVLDPDRLPALPPPVTPQVQRQPAQGTGRPGDDFNQSATWEQILEPAGWQRVYERGDESYWRRPGKRQGISATVNYKGSGVLYVFSANAVPFAPNASYTKFAAFTLLRHQGDYGAAARVLAAEGYGTPPHHDHGRHQRRRDGEH